MARINLKILRVKEGLSQNEMADKIGCSRMTYSSIESGERNGRQEFWVNLQDAFAIPDSDMWEIMKNEEN